MKKVLLSQETAAALDEFMQGGVFESPSQAIFHSLMARKQLEEEITKVRARLGPVQYETMIGLRKRASEPDPDNAKLVKADPLFSNGYHSCWGADCPVCKNYFWEDPDVTPLPVSERPTKCDYCDQKILLIYPWEIGDHLFPEPKKENPVETV